MNPKRTLTTPMAFFVLLALIGLAIFLVVENFRQTDPGSAGFAQVFPSVMTSSISPISDETQTIAAIVTFKAVEEVTYLATTRTPATPIFLPTGIIEDEPVKHSGKLLGLIAQNGWSGFVNGDHFFLYAGALTMDPEQGAVIMVITRPSGVASEQFMTPTKHGAIRAVSNVNNRLTLVALDGTIFYFDLATHQFVMNLTETVPVITPSPFSSPEPSGLPYPAPTSVNTAIP